MRRNKIIVNQIMCKRCGDVLVSHHVHDYKWCSCGAVSIDGGNEYLKRGYRFSYDDILDLSDVLVDNSKEV